jgi:hypothetical protein
VSSHLGHTSDGTHLWDSRPIDEHIALIIFNITQNKHTCYIEFPADNPMLERPMLWDIKAWRTSADKWARDKQRQHDSIIAWHMFNQNVKLMKKACMEKFLLDEDRAEAMAKSLLKKNPNIGKSLLGLDKIITKEEELE